MARSGSLSKKDEFRNVSDGWVSAVQIDGRGDHHGIAVEPGGVVWMSEEEQIATANAPRSDEDNPFLNGSYELVTKGIDIRNRRPYGVVAVADDEETGATPIVDDEPAEEGTAAPGEEVATPNARRRRKVA